MKPSTISAEALFEAHREAMRWDWIAGHAHPERHFDDNAVRDARSAADLVGYLNYVHPYRVQIVGRREVAYLDRCAPDDEPVRLLIFLLVPEAATQRHLEILSEIAEMLSDRELRERLLAEPEASVVHKLIADWQAQNSVV